MKRFTYTATDAGGQVVQGTIEAVDWQAAAAILAARGLTDCRQTGVEALPALSPADAIELAGYLSELARTGVPLDGTLRALAQDAQSAALRQAINDLSDRLAGGQPLDEALDALGARLPEHMRRLLVAASRSGHLSQALARLLERQREVDDMTRRFRQAVAYPLALVALLVGWLWFVTTNVIPPFVQLLRDDFQTQTIWLLDFAHLVPPLLLGLLAGLAILLLGIRLIRGAAGLSRFFSMLPIVGPCRAYRGLSDFAGLVSEFLDEQVPLDEALRLASTGTRDAAVRAACRTSAAHVVEGRSLSGSLAAQRLFPPSLVRWVEWGEGNAALPDALRAAARMFAERFEFRLQLVRVIIPGVVFGLIAASALFVAGSLFQGLFNLVTALSGNSSSGFGGDANYELPVLISAACVLVFGTALLIVAQIIRGRDPDADVTRVLLNAIGWILVALAVLAGFLIIASGWGFVAWLLLGFAWWRGMSRYRQSQKDSLWTALSLAADKQAPLAPMARAMADEQGGVFAISARKLAKQLESGAGLSDAIQWSPAALPRGAALAARIGSESGDLPGAVRAAGVSRRGRLLLSPLVLWLLMFLPVVIFMKLKIEPSLVAIFGDFDTTLPPITSLISGFLGSPIPAYFGLLVALVVLVAWLQWRGTLQPRLPGLKPLARWIELAPVLGMLSLATSRGRPLPQTLETIALCHPTRWVRRRVQRAVRDLAKGVSWQDSLRRGKLLAPDDLAVLAAAERNGNLPWALAELGHSYTRRADFRLKVWSEFALPLLLVAVGLTVGLFVVAYFLPLVYLIVNLS